MTVLFHVADLTIAAFVKCMDSSPVEDMLLGFTGDYITLCNKAFICYVFLVGTIVFPLCCVGSIKERVYST